MADITTKYKSKWTGKEIDEGIEKAKNAVPLDGSKAMTGALSVNGGNGKAIASADSMGISHRPTPSDATNYSFLGVFGNRPLSEAVQLWSVTAGAEKHHNILHTGNKPSGSYTGNGSSAARTIATGGLGNVCIIYGSLGVALVTANGAICGGGDGGITPKSLPSSALRFNNGTLTIKTTDSVANASGGWYEYLVP